MQELLNALFIIFIYSANQAKPIHYSVRKYTNTSIEFHSWYVLTIDEWYLTITDGERKTKVRTRLAVDGKMSPEFMKVLKDLLNKDFNSWIKIEDESSTDNVDAKVDEDNSEWTTWTWDDNSSEEKEDEKAKTQESTRKIPEWSKVQKKK